MDSYFTKLALIAYRLHAVRDWLIECEEKRNRWSLIAVHGRPCVTHDFRGAVSDRHVGATVSAGSGATMLGCNGLIVKWCSLSGAAFVSPKLTIKFAPRRQSVHRKRTMFVTSGPWNQVNGCQYPTDWRRACTEEAPGKGGA